MLLKLTALALLACVIWIGWREQILAGERQRKGYWKSKAEANDYYTTPQDFPTVSAPETDCVRIFTTTEADQP